MMAQNVAPLSDSAMTYDEVSMQRSQDFFMALQELKNLRPQLYSAAEYCESSYIYSDQKQTVLENLKDYSVKALVNAVDHLGTVAYKLNDLLSQQSSELASTDVRVSFISQQLLACQERTHMKALNQQLLVKESTIYDKHYTFSDPSDPIPEDSSKEAQPTIAVDLPQAVQTHPSLEVENPENEDAYFSRKSTGAKTDAILNLESNNLTLQQQKLKQEDGGQDEDAETLAWIFEVKGQTEINPESSPIFPQNSIGSRPSSASSSKTDTGNAVASSSDVPSVSVSAAKLKSGPTIPLMQHSKSFIGEKKSLSSLMSFEESKFLQLRQNHSRSKSVFSSLLGKRRGGK